MKQFNHIFIALTALLLGSYSSYAMDNPNPEDEDIIVESVESDDAFKATGLHDRSQAQEDALTAYILNQKRKYIDENQPEKFINPPVLILEEIIEQMGNKFAPLTNEMINYFQKDVLSIPYSHINTLEFSPNGKKLLIHQLSNNVDILDTTNLFSQLKRIRNVPITQFSPDNKYLFVIYINPQRHQTHAQLLHAHDLSQASNIILKDIRTAQFSPDGNYLYVIRENPTDLNQTYLELLHAHDLSPATKKKIPNVRLAQFSPDSKKLFIMYKDQMTDADLFDVKKLSRIKNKKLNNIDRFETKFSPHGDYIFVVYNDQTAELLYTHNLTPVRDEKLQDVASANFKPDNTQLLIQYEDGTGKLFTTDNLTPQKDLTLENLQEAQFSPDGNYIFVIYTDESAELLNSNNLTPAPIIPKQEGIINAAFSSTGAYLLMVNSSYDNMLFKITPSRVSKHPILTYNDKKNNWIFSFDPHDTYFVYQEKNNAPLNIYNLNTAHTLNPIPSNGLKLIAKIYKSDTPLLLKEEELAIYNALPESIKQKLESLITTKTPSKSKKWRTKIKQKLKLLKK